MNTDLKQRRLLSSFYTALGWNAFSYSVYKCCSMLLAFFLYKRMEQQDFTAWATLTSTTFLLLLFLDCGFRKSVPRYCPDFLVTRTMYKRFITTIILVQGAMLLIALPWYYSWVAPAFIPSVHQETQTMACWLSAAFFFLQGIIALVRLIYYAHFWNKQFNTAMAIVVSLESLTAIACCFIDISNTWFLVYILAIHCGGSLVLAMICSSMLFWLPYKTRQNYRVSAETVTGQFIVHSCFMWGSNVIKSITERNFLLPYVLYYLGPGVGAIFKLTHDAALFFYRFAHKTLATNDTSLLAYARQDGHYLKVAFAKLKKTVLLLVAGMAILACLLSFISWAYELEYLPRSSIVLFCIFFLGYMFEVALSPYERLLEVSREYRALALAYLPYCCILMLMLYTQTIATIGLVPFMVILQLLRCLSSCLMAYQARSCNT